MTKRQQRDELDDAGSRQSQLDPVRGRHDQGYAGDDRDHSDDQRVEEAAEELRSANELVYAANGGFAFSEKSSVA